MGLGPVAAAFPQGAFPTGAMHELLSDGPEGAAASAAFTAALIGPLMAKGGACIWIGPRRTVFPPGLRALGMEPDRVLFVDVRKEKEGWWVLEEALKCEGLAAVVGEIREVSFLASRRFQLAVEQSRVTGFLLRERPRNRQPIAVVARWQISPLPGRDGARPGGMEAGFGETGRARCRAWDFRGGLSNCCGSEADSLENGNWNGGRGNFIRSRCQSFIQPERHRRYGRMNSGEKRGDMSKRFLSLWFRDLTTDYMTIRRPALRDIPFAIAVPDHGRKIITAVNITGRMEGISPGMVVADARVLYPTLEVIDEQPGLGSRLLKALAVWCLRYTPLTGLDEPDGLILETTGCDHLWGGEEAYLTAIIGRLAGKGYDVRGGMADTIGAAWAVARYGRKQPIIPPGHQTTSILDLPPAALRLGSDTLARLQKLGLTTIGPIASLPRRALRRRLGMELLLRLDQAFGVEEEMLLPVLPVETYQERLPCLEPIGTAAGIGIALERLLETLCGRLQRNGKGLREAIFKAYRVDGRIMEARIGTNRGSNHAPHLFRLFGEKIRSSSPIRASSYSRSTHRRPKTCRRCKRPSGRGPAARMIPGWPSWRIASATSWGQD